MSSVLPRAEQLGPAPLSVRPLGDADREAFTELVHSSPLVNAVVAARLARATSLTQEHFGAALFGVHDDADVLQAAVAAGGNLLPVGGRPEHWHALAFAVGERPRRCSSIVGEAAAVSAYWAVLRPRWGTARDVRATQPLLVRNDARRLPPAHPGVRPMRADDLETYLPAAAAMFTEELGIPPTTGTPVDGYRRRVAALIDEGRAFGIVENGVVTFKADLGALSPHTCQIQGVWVHPELRGHGLGTAALAAVCRFALDLAPTVSLYVNDYNVAARRMYRRLGMVEVATLSTVLF